MRADAFSKRHPAVNFVFFLGAILGGMLNQHPAYLLAGVVSGAAYYLLLHGRRGWRFIGGLVPLFLVFTAVNPLFNTYGATLLFTYFDRPYTLEALYYGAALAAVFVNMLLWFGCYNAVLTSDKFTSLFGNLIPALSLLLVMVLRMIPNLMRKARQIAGARASIGRGVSEQDGTKEKLAEGMTVLGTLTSWALEGGIVTADSMRSRGYGQPGRTAFSIFRMEERDRYALLWLGFCGVYLTCGAMAGGLKWWYFPALTGVLIQPMTVSFYLVYLALCLTPVILDRREARMWRCSPLKT